MIIDIEKAKQLRQQGKTLQEVADILNCSLAWCKANLKGTKQVSKDKDLIDTIRTKGKSKDGIAGTEVRFLVKNAYQQLEGAELESKLSTIKKAARRDNKDVVIRPYWMIPEQAYDCTTMMLELAQEVYEMKDYLAKKYRKHFDLGDSFHNNIVYSLTTMSAGDYNKLMPQGLLEYGRQLGQIQDALTDRHNNKTNKVSIVDDFVQEEDTLITLDDLDSFMY